jgi:bifunctional non-homologous end joining protein LigD
VAHRHARQLVTALAAWGPEHYIVSAQADRRGPIFLDCLRKGRGTSAIGTYLLRAREGFPIADPVSWSGIEARPRP